MALRCSAQLLVLFSPHFGAILVRFPSLVVLLRHCALLVIAGLALRLFAALLRFAFCGYALGGFCSSVFREFPQPYSYFESISGYSV